MIICKCNNAKKSNEKRIIMTWREDDQKCEEDGYKPTRKKMLQ